MQQWHAAGTPQCSDCGAARAQFLTDPREATLIGLAILKQGGLAPGVQATLFMWERACMS